MRRNSENELDARLRRARPAPEFPEERIRGRIRNSIASGSTSRSGRSRWATLGMAGRTTLIVAASLVLFVLGAEYGRRTAPAGPVEQPRTLAGEDYALSLSIQSTGSQYVASLTGLAARSAALPAEQRRMAEEVALTVLYAAILELSRATDDDGILQSAAGLVSARRDLVRQ